MINQTTQIHMLPVIEAGFNYSFNPASLLGLVFFLFFIFRMHAVYEHGIFFGFCLLVSFIFMQALLHLGAIDFFAVYATGFLLFLNLLRILAAVCIGGVGLWLFFLLSRQPDRAGFFFKRVFFAGLGRPEKRGIFNFFPAAVKGFLWGVAFGFFSGTWPLSSAAIDLIFGRMSEVDISFSDRFVLFEVMAFLPFIVVLIAVSIFFGKCQQGKKTMVLSRPVLLLFAAFCFGTGFGTLCQYVAAII